MEREFRGCVFEFSIGFLQQRRILRPCAEAMVWRADDISPITLCTDRTSHVHTIPTDALLAKHYAFLPSPVLKLLRVCGDGAHKCAVWFCGWGIFKGVCDSRQTPRKELLDMDDALVHHTVLWICVAKTHPVIPICFVASIIVALSVVLPATPIPEMIDSRTSLN